MTLFDIYTANTTRWENVWENVLGFVDVLCWGNIKLTRNVIFFCVPGS